MILSVLFGQRHEDYDEQYAPEAIQISDEFSSEETPLWLNEKLEDAKRTGEWSALRIIDIDLGGGSQERIRSMLLNNPVITGDIAE